jgi:type II secretory pathway pseudopilin PulG
VEIMVVETIIGLLIGIAVPKILRARDAARLKVIKTNLRQIDEAKDQWALEYKQPVGAPIADVTVLQDYFRRGHLHEVIQETYLPNALGMPPTAALPAGVSLGPYGPGAVIPAP